MRALFIVVAACDAAVQPAAPPVVVEDAAREAVRDAQSPSCDVPPPVHDVQPPRDRITLQVFTTGAEQFMFGPRGSDTMILRSVDHGKTWSTHYEHGTQLARLQGVPGDVWGRSAAYGDQLPLCIHFDGRVWSKLRPCPESL